MGGMRPQRQIRFEVIAIAVLVRMLKLVEGSIFLIEQLPITLQHLIVDHAGEGHAGLPSWKAICQSYSRKAAERFGFR